MAILDILKSKVSTSEQLRSKLERLRAEEPLTRIPALEAARREALMRDDDKEVARLNDEIASVRNEDERREIGIETTHRELAEAEKAEHQAEVAKAVKAAEKAKRRTPDALARYEQGAKLIEEALAELEEIEDVVQEHNSLVPGNERMTTATFDYRGGRPAEPRTEAGRRVVETFWAFASHGAELSPKQVEQIEKNDANHGWLWVIDTNPGWSQFLTMPETTARNSIESDHSDYPRKRVAVERRQVVEVTHDEYRGPYIPLPLRHEVGWLPTIRPVGGDPRPARKRVTLRHVEPVAESTKAEAAE